MKTDFQATGAFDPAPSGLAARVACWRPPSWRTATTPRPSIPTPCRNWRQVARSQPLQRQAWRAARPCASALGLNQNCARCHGLKPRHFARPGKIDADCTGMADATKKAACFWEMDTITVRAAVARRRVYMLCSRARSQEAIWSIRTYIETRREP
jgi:hypothetical protein